MEVWLLESYYDNIFEGIEYHFEIYLHIPDTDIWINDIGYEGEYLEQANFTKKFWDELGEDDLFTKLGQF